MLNAGRNNDATPFVFFVVIMIVISSTAAVGSLFINKRETLVTTPYAIVHPGQLTTVTPTRTSTPTPGDTTCTTCSNICIYGSYGGPADNYCTLTRGTGFKCCRPSASSPTPPPVCPDGTREYGCCPSNNRICRRNYEGNYACIGGTTDCTPFQLAATPTRTPTRIATPTRTPTLSQNISCTNATCSITYKYSFMCGGTNVECKTTQTVKTCSSPYTSCNRTSPSTTCYRTLLGNCSDGVECTTDAQCNVEGRSGYKCQTYNLQENNYCYR